MSENVKTILVTTVALLVVALVAGAVGFYLGVDSEKLRSLKSVESSLPSEDGDDADQVDTDDGDSDEVDDNTRDFAEYKDVIRVFNPLPGAAVGSPLVVQGEARGTWFFEGDFPVVLTNWDGLIIAEGIASAQGEWMTEEYVPFEATLTFQAPEFMKERGFLILHKDNPSGLPEHDDAFEFEISFK